MTKTDGHKEHHLDASEVHNRFRPDIAPRLVIDPGDVVTVECREGFDGQVDPPVEGPDLDAGLYETISWSRLAPLTGPIAIRGAEPGDTLEVRIHDLVPFGTGNLIIFPAWMDGDFISQKARADYPQAWIRHFDMDRAARDGFVDYEGLKVPLRPMLGVVGTAPAKGDFTTTGAPRFFGGNMDIRDIAAGSRVYLPVQCPGALFSAGDGHGMQGDGEIGATGLETPMRARLEFHLHKGRKLETVQIETGDEFMVVGWGRTLDDAGRRAIEFMVEELATRRGLSRHAAYGLLSLAGDLKVNQVVDLPNLGMRLSVPKAIFGDWKW